VEILPFKRDLNKGFEIAGTHPQSEKFVEIFVRRFDKTNPKKHAILPTREKLLFNFYHVTKNYAAREFQLTV